jgi:DnaJ homolog subfamily A member 2
MRAGDNLIYKHEINLLEALTGFELALTHLDGRVLVIRGEPNTLIQTGMLRAMYRRYSSKLTCSCYIGDIHVVPNEGMPLKQNPFLHGALHIKFSVKFPSTITPDIAKVCIQLITRASSPNRHYHEWH